MSPAPPAPWAGSPAEPPSTWDDAAAWPRPEAARSPEAPARRPPPPPLPPPPWAPPAPPAPPPHTAPRTPEAAADVAERDLALTQHVHEAECGRDREHHADEQQQVRCVPRVRVRGYDVQLLRCVLVQRRVHDEPDKREQRGSNHAEARHHLP